MTHKEDKKERKAISNKKAKPEIISDNEIKKHNSNKATMKE